MSYLLAACVAAVMAYSGLLARLVILDDPGKIAVPLASSRTDPSDNYVYFSLLKRGVKSCRGPSGSEGATIHGNPLACSYIGGLFVDNLIWRVAEALAPSGRAPVVLLLIVNTTLLALTFLYALGEILGRSFSIGAAIVVAFGMLHALDNFSLSFYAGELNLGFQSVLSLEPGFARLVNPSTFWMLGFGTIALTIRQMRQPGIVRLVCTIVVAVTCGLAGLGTSAALAGGLGLYLIAHLAARRRVAWPLAAICAAIVAGMAYSFLQLRLFYATPLGADLQHGQAVGLHLNPSMLYLIVPVMFGKICPDDPEVNLLAKCLLVAAMVIGLGCESFELGNRLWLRGAAAIAFLVCLAWLWRWGERLAGAWLSERVSLLPSAVRKLSAVAIVALLLPIGIYARPPQFDRARGFIDRDKFDVLSWLAPRVGPDTQVASTNIEDSFLVEYYTRAAPFVPLYGLSTLRIDQDLRRYFYVMDLVQEGEPSLDKIGGVTKSSLDEYNVALKFGFRDPADYDLYQSLAFFHMLLYYPYSRNAADIFRSNEPSAGFRDRLGRLRVDAHNETARFDYLIMRADQHLRDPALFVVIYRNQSYVVLQAADAGARRS